MTRLRKMMLDELERRNYSQNTRRICLYAVTGLPGTFTARRTSLGSMTFASTRRTFFESASSRPTASVYMWKRCGFYLCMSSSAGGQWTTCPTRKDHKRFPSSSATRRSAQLINSATTPRTIASSSWLYTQQG